MRDPVKEDVLLGKSFDWRLFVRLFRFAAPYWGYLLLSLALLLLYTGVRILQPYLVKVAIDSHVANHDLGGLDRVAWAYLGLAVAGFVFRYFQTMAMQISGQRAMNDQIGRAHV